MAASEELARRVVEAGRSCSLTTAVLEEWSVFANVGVDGTLSRFSTLRSWAC